MNTFKVYAHAGENHPSSQPEAKTLQKFNQEMPDDMMGPGRLGMPGMMNSWFPAFGLTLQILTIALLVVLVRYFWKKAN